MTNQRIEWLRLTLLGLLGGGIAAALVLGFRHGLDHGQQWLLPTGVPGDFESLSPAWRVVLPTAAGLLLGLARLPQLDLQLAPCRGQQVT